ncbi:molybdopterin-binding protein [Pedobacter lusitanus]|uniref:Molybdopterin-binding protein n=1 Tax=Pedobacter lusitanus TaxID=1503925 RepID=A0A0D0GF02_9SPHI|nr:molybdopterin-dependent oxidoreductase [Pedobacter lusitanus]KIO75847.1 molybdopterin-binding protein [Pedobacter lusitanus]
MKKQLLTLLITVCALSTPFLMQGQTLEKETPVKVGGEVKTPLLINGAELGKFRKTLVNRKDRDGNNHVYSGAVLADILQQAGAVSGKELKGANLTKYLLVEAIDGYQVIFAMAELYPDFTDRVIILANEMDGKPLPASDGPFRIIVQDEKKPARCIKQVTGLFVKNTGQ